ncbi:hypothetical protein BDW75DRAFT_207222 [Aspergillus navahoensis]
MRLKSRNDFASRLSAINQNDMIRLMISLMILLGSVSGWNDEWDRLSRYMPCWMSNRDSTIELLSEEFEDYGCYAEI